jgi:hypothetical protein
VLFDANGTFQTSNINTSHIVFILSGADAGFYQVQTVNSETDLTVDSNFPATLTGISYQIVSVFGVSKDSLDALFAIYSGLAALLTSATMFKALISTQVPVVRLSLPDPNSFATALLLTDLNTRDMAVDLRLAAVPSDIATVTAILTSTDAIYDKRYVWVDARINLESGLLVKQETAMANRIKAQLDIYNQLVKLLAV